MYRCCIRWTHFIPYYTSDGNQARKQITPCQSRPSVDVNTVPLTKYRKLFPAHFTKAGNLKQKALHPTRHMWTGHDETPQQFLGYFIANIHHKTIPEVLLIRFYVFKDTTSPKILLSYAASERLGIVKFQIPNEAPSIALDTISTKKHSGHHSTHTDQSSQRTLDNTH